MTKTIALIALVQTALVFSPVVRADDAKPAQNAAAPTANVAKSDTASAAKDEDGDCKGKHCKHCKMHKHAKKGDKTKTETHEG